MQFIFLIGPPGSGKTVCGLALAQKLDCRFFDTDQLIESQQACSIKSLFAERGEEHFRQLETQLLESLPSTYTETGTIVFATGGGLPIYNDNLQRLERLGKVIALRASLDVLVERVKGDNGRPLLASAPGSIQEPDKQLEDRLSELLASRSPVYEQAGYKIDTSGLKPDEVAHEIIRMVFGDRR